jgi:hypothetical protein
MGIILLHSEAIKLLNEISVNRPELLQSAVSINLREDSKEGTEIVIRCNFQKQDIDLLRNLANDRNHKITQAEDVLVIN